ncbi:MAG: hypothetical protein MUC36_02030 [Planctomycetes bacterium]|jgi:hypothetical protein|nr:hypothetical protein [Planctomycetota bacterium]
MKNERFAEDPDPRTGDLHVAVRDLLRSRGWLDQRRLADSRRWIPDELSSAVEKSLVDFFAAWHQHVDLVDVRWLDIAKALGAAPESDPFLEDPRHDLCELFCLVAGIGDAGRAFDKAVGQAGLLPERRSDQDLRTLATSIRGIDREHFADVELPGKSGLLFERIVRWPFTTGGAAIDWKGAGFRCDLQRYCECTGLDLSEVDDERSPPRCDRSLGQPQNLGTWLEVLGLKVAGEWFAGCLQRTPRTNRRDQVSAAAAKLREGLEAWMVIEGHAAGAFSSAGPEFQDEAGKVFAALLEHAIDVRLEAEPDNAWFRFEPNSVASRRMWFARAGFDGRAERMPAGVATKWGRLVKQELSSFRPLLEQEDRLPDGWKECVLSFLVAENSRVVASTELERESMLVRERRRVAERCHDLTLLYPGERFERGREHFLACADQVLQLEGLWEGMRQLLLAMRALKSPCVAVDLRYWDEPGVKASHHPRQPEEPWRCIPAKLVASFHALVGKEEAKDPELKALRSQFADFCLKGLRDKWNEKQRAEAESNGRERTNDDMVESSPEWRYCRVRAAKTLAINPEGRGHRLLQTSSEIDPDPKVREVANDAYQSLRRGVTLPEGMSPRRAVLGAFWWLRQAHLKALGYEIDRDGAQRTRIKELSRTKESERN